MPIITPTWPTEGETNWDDDLLVGLGQIVTALNTVITLVESGRLSNTTLTGQITTAITDAINTALPPYQRLIMLMWTGTVWPALPTPLLPGTVVIYNSLSDITATLPTDVPVDLQWQWWKAEA